MTNFALPIAQNLSLLCANSLANSPDSAKPGSLDIALDNVAHGHWLVVTIGHDDDGHIYVHDGRHTLEACVILGVTPTVMYYD